MKFIYFLSLLTFLFIFSCEKMPNGGIPSYVSIENASLLTSNGNAEHGINTVWAETEGENLGVYEIPNVIPALVNGEREIILNAGVYANGDYFKREIYPAFKPFKSNINFIYEDTVIVNPVFEYYDDVNFIIEENFESGNIFSTADRTAPNDTNNVDGRCLHIALNETDSVVKILTSSAFTVPNSGRQYMEIQMKATNDFAIGVQALNNGQVSSESYIQVYLDHEDWIYIYQDITLLINQLQAESYVFFIQSSKYNSINETDIYIDNFKILNF